MAEAFAMDVPMVCPVCKNIIDVPVVKVDDRGNVSLDQSVMFKHVWDCKLKEVQ